MRDVIVNLGNTFEDVPSMEVGLVRVRARGWIRIEGSHFRFLWLDGP